jgi:tetratricopeptide (TPR) repeat protein
VGARLTNDPRGWLIVLSGAIAVAGETVCAAATAANPGTAANPYTYVHHAVSTDISAAQFAFDRGLTMVLAYEQDEGERAFREAARLDPSLAMAWWGVALAVGPNINYPPEPKGTKVGAESLERAKLLAEKRATPQEREYIEALSARYSSDEKPDYDKLAIAYREAMRRVVHAHPNDADAAALYAEAIMDLHPWQLWTSDGKPGPDTTELVDLLESNLKRNPQHIGLLHFYIHAVEASPDPGRSVAVARRLGMLPMEPAENHLVHMPAHTYLRVGDWASAIEANEHSLHGAFDYVVAENPKTEPFCGHYAAFITYAYMMVGDEPGARRSALDCKGVNNDPTRALSVLMRFHAWDDILVFPEPSPDPKGYGKHVHAVTGFWHFSRGLAFTSQGRLDRADKELKALQDDAALLPQTVELNGALGLADSGERLWTLSNSGLLKIAAAILTARLAEARGQLAPATQSLRDAVQVEDGMPYGEPPTWFYPVRESLGALLLRRGDAAEAVSTFREGLRRSPNDPRLLFGLFQAETAVGRAADAEVARKEFAVLWKGEGEPKVADF